MINVVPLVQLSIELQFHNNVVSLVQLSIELQFRKYWFPANSDSLELLIDQGPRQEVRLASKTWATLTSQQERFLIGRCATPIVIPQVAR